ncbi:MAG: translocation/assembly module TamB, partial [Flavobacteriales bacterium]|nr:translocation/assembly module TamB [Flavobacteriales bacterium]
INLLIDNIRLEGDTIFGNMARMNFMEHRGFFVKNLAGKVKVGPTELLINELKIQTAISDIDLDLHYTYNRWGDWHKFIDNVTMDYTIRESIINVKDIAFFAPPLKGLKEKLKIKGRVYGLVSSINGRDLNLSYGRNTHLIGDIDMDGLPNIQVTFLYFDLKKFESNYYDISSMPMPPFDSGKKIVLPKNVLNLGKMNFKGNFTGFINDFVAYGKLRTSIGELRTDISLKQDNATGTFTYDGSLQAIGFDIGDFLQVKNVGKVTLKADVSGSGFSKEDVNANLVGEVQSIKILSYEYQNIEVNGMFVNSQFNGDLTVADENVDMVFHGGIDLSQELPEFVFHSHIKRANLYGINLLRKREDATVTGTVEVDFIGNDIDNLIGSISISNATYQQKDDTLYAVNSFELLINEDSLSKTLKLESAVLDASFSGKFSFRNIRKATNNVIRKHLPSYAKDFEFLKPDEGLDFDFNVKLKDTEILTYFLLPELSVSDSSTFSGSYSSSRNELFLRGRLPEMAYNGIVFDNVQIEAENPGKEFEFGVYADAVHFSDSMYLKDVGVRTFTFNDSLGLVVKWNNKSKLENSAFIQGVASFEKNKQVSFHLKPSKIVVADMEWEVDSRNLVTIDSSTFSFTRFQFTNRNQYVSLNGMISKDENEKLEVGLGRFDLSSLNVFSKKSGLKLMGEISGKAQLSGVYSKLFLTNQLQVDSLVVNDVMIGTGELNNTWIPATRTVQIFGLLQRDGKTTLSLVGEYLPGNDRIQNFNIKAMIDRIPLNVFNPYVKMVISEIDGNMMADISIKGTRSKPELSGKVVLRNAKLHLNYFNTDYRISDTVIIKRDGFYFKDLLVLDERDKEGRINGSITHTAFKDFKFDANLEVNNFLAMNTNSAMNPLYYGKAYGTGLVKFTGDPKNMHFDVAMKSERGTRFQIPLFGAETIDNSDFITFVKPKGEQEEVDFEKEFSVEFKNVTVDMDIEVTDDAVVELIFDPKVGDVIKGKGFGDIRMSLDRTGSFKMFGDYYIQKGEYLFTLQNIINKKFLMKQGGTINWSGDPYDALVNIEASYRVRTSLYDLMYPDTTEDDYKKRVQVDCILKMTDNLLTPKIAFDVDLPNSDERINTEVRNRIGVGNEQEMNRQVFGLLVLNKFLPPENQNVAQETGGFFTASSAEVLSNQVSNWLSKVSNDFDVGLNYRPGDDITNDELELALSTQVFNNRIIVDGNVGVTNTQSSSSNIVGDVNIEYKITSDGKFRVRAFNKSNDINTLTNNAPFTQGVGISYQKNFDRLGDLFRRRNKKKRQEKVE